MNKALIIEKIRVYFDNQPDVCAVLSFWFLRQGKSNGDE